MGSPCRMHSTGGGLGDIGALFRRRGFPGCFGAPGSWDFRAVQLVASVGTVALVQASTFPRVSGPRSMPPGKGSTAHRRSRAPPDSAINRSPRGSMAPASPLPFNPLFRARSTPYRARSVPRIAHTAACRLNLVSLSRLVSQSSTGGYNPGRVAAKLGRRGCCTAAGSPACRSKGAGSACPVRSRPAPRSRRNRF